MFNDRLLHAGIALLIIVCSAHVYAKDPVLEDPAPEKMIAPHILWGETTIGMAWANDDTHTAAFGQPGLALTFALATRPWPHLGFEAGVRLLGVDRSQAPPVQVQQRTIVGQLGVTFWPLVNGWFQPSLTFGGALGEAQIKAKLANEDALGESSSVQGGVYLNTGIDFVILGAKQGGMTGVLLLGIEVCYTAFFQDTPSIETTYGRLRGLSGQQDVLGLNLNIGFGF